MADQLTTPEAELEFLDTLYGDPLRPMAMKSGRNLVIGALLLLAVTKFGATVQSTALFPVSFTGRPDVLPTVLSILVVVLLLSFLSTVIPDLLGYREVEVRIVRFIQAQRVEHARAAARAIDESQEDYDGEVPDSWWEDAAVVWKEAQEVTDRVERRLGHRKFPRAMRLVRVIGEVSVPLGLAALALWETHSVFHW